MILTFENIAHYLLEKGLVTLDDIVAGKFSVRDNSSRNTNFAVNKEHPPGYLVKQVRAKDMEKTQTMRIEATCYWLANNDEQYQVLKNFLPKYHEYDYLNHILIIELLPEVQSLYDYHYGTGNFPIPVAESLADLMASYHCYELGKVQQGRSFQLFKKNKPWVFSLLDNSLDEWMNSSMGSAEKQVLQLVLKNQEFVELLKPIREDWEVTSLLHGDIKFPNFIINRSYDESAAPDVRLIDWELADMGDPLWDVAAIFQNYLSLWVSVEIANQQQGQKQLQTFSLENMQPSINAFWKKYVANNGWDVADTQAKLDKTVRYTAFKLLHSCFESSQYSKDIQLFTAKTLQLSLNLLKFPNEAVGELLGIQKQCNNATATAY
ncbi:MAG: phosphotransferase [Bacteroidetes bacterium]|nr:phosphotransferase [Bacteroidota bacterium]